MTADEIDSIVTDAEIAICESLRDVQARGIPFQELAVVIDVPADGGENMVNVVPRRGIEMPDEEQQGGGSPRSSQSSNESARGT